MINALRSVATQIMLGFDAHGVVNETVTVMPFAYKSFVNALSRKIVNDIEGDRFFKNESISIQNSMPHWIVKELQTTFGEDHTKYLPLFNQAPCVTLFGLDRSLNNADETIQTRFTSGDIVVDAKILESAGDIGELQIIKDGNAIVVDQGSQLIVKNIPLKDTDIVLDLCSAPGGKSFMMSTKAKHIYANDIAHSRMKKFVDTKKRTKINNVSGIVSDGTKSCFIDKAFDVVLVDAPCSGLGVLRRRPDARNSIKDTIVKDLFELQKSIISESIGLVKPNGIYVYSVCTFTNMETIEIDNWISRNHPHFKEIQVEDLPENIIKRSRGYLLPPGQYNDSMYFLILENTSNE